MPVITMPLSLIGGFFVMLVLGYSINLLTLLALVLAIGLVVDDAIIVVENVDRHMKEGKTPLQASLIAARELGGPIIAMTIVLIAVYVPIGFQGGLTGALFTEFAFTLAGAVTMSAVIALTL
jgi:multidrug efflux pump